MIVVKRENFTKFLNQRRWYVFNPSNTPDYTIRLNELIYTPEVENGELKIIFDDNDYLEVEILFSVYRFPSDNSDTIYITDFNQGHLIYESIIYAEIYGYNVVKSGSTLLALNGLEHLVIRYPEEVKNRLLTIRVINWSPFLNGPDYKTMPCVFVKAIYYYYGGDNDDRTDRTNAGTK